LKLKETLGLRAFAFLKIPLINHLKPVVEDLTEDRVEIKIPLRRASKNHLDAMYFGALAVGADCAGGLIAMNLIRQKGNAVSLVFKDFKADFLKRAEGDVHFVCEQGREIAALVEKSMKSSERQNIAVNVTAFVPKKGPEPVAQFILTLSLKKRAS
jgi:acyl-coenzyme A thioesterase PaaI-like protein